MFCLSVFSFIFILLKCDFFFLFFFYNTFWERSRNTATLHSCSYLFYVNGSYDYSKFALIYSCFLVLPSVNKAKCYVFLSYCYLSFIFVPNYHWWFGWVNVIKFNEQLVAMKKKSGESSCVSSIYWNKEKTFIIPYTVE